MHTQCLDPTTNTLLSKVIISMLFLLLHEDVCHLTLIEDNVW